MQVHTKPQLNFGSLKPLKVGKPINKLKKLLRHAYLNHPPLFGLLPPIEVLTNTFSLRIGEFSNKKMYFYVRHSLLTIKGDTFIIPQSK